MSRPNLFMTIDNKFLQTNTETVFITN